MRNLKNKFTLVAFLLLSIYFFSRVSYAERIYTGPDFVFEPATNIRFTIDVLTTYDTTSNKYSYNYKLTIHPDSVQKFDGMSIEYGGNTPNVVPPPNWRGKASKKTRTLKGKEVTRENFTVNNTHYTSWYMKGDDFLLPGTSQDNLILENCDLPGIVNYYVRGYAEPVIFEEEVEDAVPNEISNYYLNSVNGKTIGPVDPPTSLNPSDFTDKIIGYVVQSSTLGWISDSTVSTDITSKLTTAKGKIGIDNPGAKTTLDSILSDLEAKHGNGINNEAYFLIKFNVMSLKDRL